MVPSINRRKRTGVIVWALSSSSDAVRLPRVSAAGPVPANTRTRSPAPAPARRPPASRARPPASSPVCRPPATRARPSAPAPARRRPVPGPRLRFVPSLNLLLVFSSYRYIVTVHTEDAAHTPYRYIVFSQFPDEFFVIGSISLCDGHCLFSPICLRARMVVVVNTKHVCNITNKKNIY